MNGAAAKKGARVRMTASDVLLNNLADAITVILVSKDFKRTKVNLVFLKRYGMLLARLGDKKKSDLQKV